MENIKRCCFCGHSDIWDSGAEEKIKQVAEDLILNHNVKEFWVGNYGNFDSCSATVIKELKKIYTDIRLDLVVPYLTNSINEHKELYYKRFDNILLADIPENTPKRFHITKSNEYMVDNSEFLICYIERSWGGAVKTYKYAKRRKLKIFNIAENPIEE